MEKIKRDNDRVDISKIDESDVTGGYIIRSDHGDADWYSTFGVQGNSDHKLGLQYYYPKRENITPEQQSYIISYLDSLERAIKSPSHSFAGKHYSEYIDLESFAEYFLVSEFSHNIDAYRLSAYLHKDIDSNGGLMKAGPIWDYNLALGNAEYCQGSNPNLWEYLGECSYTNPFWWQSLMEDVEFRNLVKCKWYELRDEAFSVERLHDLIDNSTRKLDSAINRNFGRWPVIGEYIWPNAFVFNSYSDEVLYLKNYIEDRWSFIDENIPGNCSTVNTKDIDNDFLHIYPNPALDIISIASNQTLEASIIIYNLIGKQIISRHLEGNELAISLEGLIPGTYLISVLADDTSLVIKQAKFIKLLIVIVKHLVWLFGY